MPKQPQIKKVPTEIFDYSFTDHSEKAQIALENQYCHYIRDECKKPRKSEPHIKVGICSVGYKGSFQETYKPVIICPHRFLEPVIFETIKEQYLPDWPDEQIKWISEVNIGVGGNVDFVAARVSERSEKIEDFLCVEFQAAGTTGTPWPAVLEFKKNREFSSNSYSYGINWANEFMKTMMQQVYKKGKIIKHWGTKIIFVVQDVAIDYLHHVVDTSDIRQAQDEDEIHFVTFNLEWESDGWILQHKDSLSTNLEGINKILGGANQERYPSVDEFKEFIYSKGKSDGIL